MPDPQNFKASLHRGSGTFFRDVIDIENKVARHTRNIPVGNIYVDGVGVGDVGDLVLRDHKPLSEDGMLVVVLTISKTERKLVSEPDSISRGFVYGGDFEQLIKNVNRLIAKTATDLLEANKTEWNGIKKNIKKSVGQYLFSHTKKKPMILPIIIEI